MSDVYDWRGKLLDEPDHREDALWMAGYDQGVKEGVLMGTALMAQVREAARHLIDAVLAKHVVLSGPPELLDEVHRACSALEALVEEA